MCLIRTEVKNMTCRSQQVKQKVGTPGNQQTVEDRKVELDWWWKR